MGHAKGRPLAVVTGASKGVGLELARLAAEDGHDLVLAANDEAVKGVGAILSILDVGVTAQTADLATDAGIESVLESIDSRPVSLVLADAGDPLENAEGPSEVDAHTSEAIVRGTFRLVRSVAHAMRAQHAGRILLVGGLAGRVSSTVQAVYQSTKGLFDSLAAALRAELAGSGVKVMCLLPRTNGRTDCALMDTRDATAADGMTVIAEDVARTGYDAVMKSERGLLEGWR